MAPRNTVFAFGWRLGSSLLSGSCLTARLTQ